MKKIYIPLSIVTVVIGCSANELRRKEAERIIRDQFQYPHAMDFNVFRANARIGQLALNSNLDEDGYITIDQQSGAGEPMIHFTDKAEPYLLPTSDDHKARHIQKVKIADEDLVEITGIVSSGDGKTAVVEYTVELTNLTPFLALMPQKPKASKVNEKANFIRYDDGWRLVK